MISRSSYFYDILRGNNEVSILPLVGRKSNIISDRRIIWFGYRIIDSIFSQFSDSDSWFGFDFCQVKIRFGFGFDLFLKSWFGFDSDSIFHKILIRFGFGFVLFWKHDSDSDSDSVKKRIISNHKRLLIDLNLLEIYLFMIRFYSKCSFIF